MDDLSLEDIIANWLAGEERLCHARAKTCLAKCCLFKKVCVCVCVCVVFEGGGEGGAWSYRVLVGFLQGLQKGFCEDSTKVLQYEGFTGLSFT